MTISENQIYIVINEIALLSAVQASFMVCLNLPTADKWAAFGNLIHINPTLPKLHLNFGECRFVSAQRQLNENRIRKLADREFMAYILYLFSFNRSF